MVKRGGVIASVLVLICVGAPPALGQSASQQGYNGEAPVGQVEGLSPQQQEFAAGGDSVPTEAVSESAGQSGNGGALPFTGWDLGIVLALGLALAGTGLAVRRAARSPAD
jgi:hypothetical protein